jgi:hypothetical protein
MGGGPQTQLQHTPTVKELVVSVRHDERWAPLAKRLDEGAYTPMLNGACDAGKQPIMWSLTDKMHSARINVWWQHRPVQPSPSALDHQAPTDKGGGTGVKLHYARWVFKRKGGKRECQRRRVHIHESA